MSLRDLAAWEAAKASDADLERIEASASRAARHEERLEIARYLYARADETQDAARSLLLRMARNVEAGTYKQTNKQTEPTK